MPYIIQLIETFEIFLSEELSGLKQLTEKCHTKSRDGSIWILVGYRIYYLIKKLDKIYFWIKDFKKRTTG